MINVDKVKKHMDSFPLQASVIFDEDRSVIVTVDLERLGQSMAEVTESVLSYFEWACGLCLDKIQMIRSQVAFVFVPKEIYNVE